MTDVLFYNLNLFIVLYNIYYCVYDMHLIEQGFTRF